MFVKLAAGLRHHSTRHVQPPDNVAGGREAALQLKHGDHADRKQEVPELGKISIMQPKTVLKVLSKRSKPYLSSLFCENSSLCLSNFLIVSMTSITLTTDVKSTHFLTKI